MTSPFQPSQTIIVRMRVNSQHIQFETLSHSSPLPATGKLAPRLKRGGPFCALVPGPLFSRHRGPFLGRSKFLGAFKAPRTSSRIQDANQPTRGLSNTFHLLGGFLGLHDRKRTIGDVAPCAEKLSIRSVK